MKAQDIIKQIKDLGKDSYKKVIMKHGAREPVYGASIADMKSIVKGIKKDYTLALELYDSGIYDAMYLAGLIADDNAMTQEDLGHWLEKAYCPGLAENTVAWVATEGRFGVKMADLWIDSSVEMTSLAGWATYGGLVAIKDDKDLDLSRVESLLDRVNNTIKDQPDRVSRIMNSFVSCVGAYVLPLSEKTQQIARSSSHLTPAQDMIEKVKNRGTLGKKRKTVKC